MCKMTLSIYYVHSGEQQHAKFATLTFFLCPCQLSNLHASAELAEVTKIKHANGTENKTR